MKKKEFQNLPSTETPITAENLNEMQDNIEESCVIVSPTEPTTNEKVWIQKGKNIYNPNTMPFSTGLWGNSNDKKVFANSGGKYVVIPIQGGTTITISKESNAIYYATTSTYPAEGVSFLDNWTGSETINKVTITTNQNAKYLFLGLYGITKLMVEYNSEATEYEAYVEKAIHTKNENGVYEEFYNESKKNKTNYSTTEQVIGTWIDGRPLYRKTISCGKLPNASNKEVSFNISNIDKMVNFYGISNSTGYSMTLPNPESGNKVVGLYIEYEKSVIGISTYQDRSAYTETYVTLEYIKKTD